MRFIASFLVLVFVSTNVAFAHKPATTLWRERERTKMIQLASLPTSLPLAGQRHRLEQKLLQQISAPAARSTVPARFGRHDDLALPHGLLSHLNIREVSRRPGSLTVVLIEDVHQNQEAQAHISSAIRSLGALSFQKRAIIGLEGASGGFLFDVYKKLSNRSFATAVADAALKSGEIGGPSHAGLTSYPMEEEARLDFVGVDDPTLYRANVAAYKRSKPIRDVVLHHLAALRERNEKDKKRTFSPELLSFDRLVASYRRGETSLADALRAFTARGIEGSLMTDLFLKASEMEKDMDLGHIEAERAAVVRKLVETLTESDLQSLVSLGLGYQRGNRTFGEYYEALRGLCRKAGIDLTKTPRFNDYIRYVLLVDGIKAERLFADAARLEAEIYGRLSQTPEQKKIAALSNQIYLAGELINFALTSPQWSRYIAGRGLLPESLDLSTFEAFYLAAAGRDERMVENLLAVIARRSEAIATAPQTTRDLATTKLAVLVAGGFHTRGLTEQLRKRGVSYIVASPRMTEVDLGDSTHYLSVFDREKTPLEKIFSGQKLFTVNPVGGAVKPLLPDAPNPVVDLFTTAGAGSLASSNGDETSAENANEADEAIIENVTGQDIRDVKPMGRATVIYGTAPDGTALRTVVVPAGAKIRRPSWFARAVTGVKTIAGLSIQVFRAPPSWWNSFVRTLRRPQVRVGLVVAANVVALARLGFGWTFNQWEWAAVAGLAVAVISTAIDVIHRESQISEGLVKLVTGALVDLEPRDFDFPRAGEAPRPYQKPVVITAFRPVVVGRIGEWAGEAVGPLIRTKAWGLIQLWGLSETTFQRLTETIVNRSSEETVGLVFEISKSHDLESIRAQFRSGAQALVHFRWAKSTRLFIRDGASVYNVLRYEYDGKTGVILIPALVTPDDLMSFKDFIVIEEPISELRRFAKPSPAHDLLENLTNAFRKQNPHAVVLHGAYYPELIDHLNRAVTDQRANGPDLKRTAGIVDPESPSGFVELPVLIALSAIPLVLAALWFAPEMAGFFSNLFHAAGVWLRSVPGSAVASLVGFAVAASFASKGWKWNGAESRVAKELVQVMSRALVDLERFDRERWRRRNGESGDETKEEPAVFIARQPRVPPQTSQWAEDAFKGTDDQVIDKDVIRFSLSERHYTWEKFCDDIRAEARKRPIAGLFYRASYFDDVGVIEARFRSDEGRYYQRAKPWMKFRWSSERRIFVRDQANQLYNAIGFTYYGHHSVIFIPVQSDGIDRYDDTVTMRESLEDLEARFKKDRSVDERSADVAKALQKQDPGIVFLDDWTHQGLHDYLEEIASADHGKQRETKAKRGVASGESGETDAGDSIQDRPGSAFILSALLAILSVFPIGFVFAAVVYGPEFRALSHDVVDGIFNWFATSSFLPWSLEFVNPFNRAEAVGGAIGTAVATALFWAKPNASPVDQALEFESRFSAGPDNGTAPTTDALVESVLEKAPAVEYALGTITEDVRKAHFRAYVEKGRVLDPKARLAHWIGLFSYFQAIMSGGATTARAAVKEFFRNRSSGSELIVYHYNQLGDPSLLAVEKDELETVLEEVRHRRKEGQRAGLVVAVHGANDAMLKDLGYVSSVGFATLIAVSDEMRDPSSGAYSYNALLDAVYRQNRPKGEGPLVVIDGVRKGAPGSRFLTLSKMPAAFQATGVLRMIWQALANIGLGWKNLPVEDILEIGKKAAKYA